ncbi:MAG: hypothetical protein HFH61_03820, partial [Lachnospiraceae bacterium]|nr:hypothetical protein [Lachnospiraceae bacterium]
CSFSSFFASAVAVSALVVLLYLLLRKNRVVSWLGIDCFYLCVLLTLVRGYLPIDFCGNLTGKMKNGHPEISPRYNIDIVLLIHNKVRRDAYECVIELDQKLAGYTQVGYHIEIEYQILGDEPFNQRKIVTQIPQNVPKITFLPNGNYVFQGDTILQDPTFMWYGLFYRREIYDIQFSASVVFAK